MMGITKIPWLNGITTMNSINNIIPYRTFAKLSPSESIWEKIVYIRPTKFSLSMSSMKRLVTLIAKSNEVGKATILFVTINMVGNKIGMGSAALASTLISFKSNFFVHVKCSGINFIWFLTSCTQKFSRRASSIFASTLFAFNNIWSYRHNLYYIQVQSIIKGGC